MAELILAQATETTPAPAATATGTTVPARAEREVFPPFNPETFPSQLLWLAISFVALYVLLARVAIPRIGGIIADRKGRIAGDIAKAESAKADTEAALAAYEKALAAARDNANTIAEEAREKSKAASDAERAGIEADLGRKLAAAETRVADIKAKALSEVGAIAAEATGAIVKALIDVDTPRNDIDAAVGEAMRK